MPAPSALGSRAIVGAFYDALDVAMGQSWAGLVSMPFDSNQASETYKWLGATPAIREWIGGRLLRGLRANGITIENKRFEGTLEVDVDDLRRDKTGQIMIRVGELADRMAAHWAALLTTLIVNGTGATNGLAYDGEYFFDASRTVGGSGAQTNLLTYSNVAALEVTTPAAPTESEMALAILGCIGFMMAWKDDQGEPVNENARQFLVMCPYTLWGAAIAACTKANLTGASGAVSNNPLAASGFQVVPVMNARLTDDDLFYVFRTDGRTKALIRQEEEGVQLQYLAEGSEQEILNNRHVYGVKALRNVGYGMWWQAAHCQLH